VDEQSSLFRFRAKDHPADSRREVLQEGFCRGILNIDFSPVGDDLDYEMEVRLLGDVVISTGWNSAHYATNYDRSRDRDDYLLVWATAGGLITHLGRELESVSDAAFLSCAERVTAQSQTTLHHRTLRLPRRMLQGFLPDADDLLARRLSTGTDTFRLLEGYVDLLCQRRPEEPGASLMAANHVCELVAHAVRGAEAERSEEWQGGVRSARLAAIKVWIQRHLAEPGLSIHQAATAQRLSERYIQMLFSAEQTTFSDFVRTERLYLARRRLLCPTARHRPISTIAFDAGFSDLSYFNRCFRTHFGATPSEVRERGF